MKISEIMSSPVVICLENDTIARVRNLMLSNKVSRIIITDNEEKPIGIITQKDIIQAINKKSPRWRRRPLSEILIKNLMSKNLISINAQSKVLEAVKKMKKTGFSALPVVEDQKLVGIISKTDIVKALPSIIDSSLQVKNFMTTPVITAKITHSIVHIHDLMRENNISRVIIEENSKPLGIITSKDIVFMKHKDYELEIKNKEFIRVKNSIKKSPNRPRDSPIIMTDEIMEKNLITIKENESIISASKLMIKNNIGGLPVVAKNPPYNLVGIITKRDIINGIPGGKK